MSGLYLVNENIIISTKIYHLKNDILNIDFSNYTNYNISKSRIELNLSNNEYLLINKNDNVFINIYNQEFRVLIFE